MKYTVMKKILKDLPLVKLIAQLLLCFCCNNILFHSGFLTWAFYFIYISVSLMINSFSFSSPFLIEILIVTFLFLSF